MACRSEPLHQLRNRPLSWVAQACGYRRDPRDPNRWKRPGSILSITGTQFYDHRGGTGGGGAIDLVMHARGCGFRDAVAWLQQVSLGEHQPRPAVVTHTGSQLPHDTEGTTDHHTTPWSGFQRVDRKWPRVRHYLRTERRLDPELLDQCYQQHLLGADARGNAVFITRDAMGTAVGAEVHGTLPGCPFRGMSRGSRKARGGFWLARPETGSTLLVESAIDALSVCALREATPFQYIISTAGVTPTLPLWIRELVPPPSIWCGYDADGAGDQAARHLITSHPAIRRLRPRDAKDWNACLQARYHR